MKNSPCCCRLRASDTLADAQRACPPVAVSPSSLPPSLLAVICVQLPSLLGLQMRSGGGGLEFGSHRKSPMVSLLFSHFSLSHCYSEIVVSPSDGVVGGAASAAAGDGFLRSSSPSPLSIERFEWRTRCSAIHRDSPSF